MNQLFEAISRVEAIIKPLIGVEEFGAGLVG
jgi:hypothetical protein